MRVNVNSHVLRKTLRRYLIVQFCAFLSNLIPTKMGVKAVLCTPSAINNSFLSGQLGIESQTVKSFT